MKRVIIIGGGFGGINLAKHLAGKMGLEVILVDRNNYNFFPPLLYQVATGYLEPSNISYPFRKLFRNKKNVFFRMGEFQRVMPNENKVVLSSGVLDYDYLVFATGAETNYFGMENVKQHALPMKTVNDALRLRNHFLKQLERATITTDVLERTKLLTIVIAGGGPTGVEVAGMLAEMKKYVIPKDYPEITGRGFESHIYLVDGVNKLLSPMSEKSQSETLESLLSMGVEVKLGMQVKDFLNDEVSFASGEKIETKTLVWAAGVTAAVYPDLPDASYGKGKRLLVNEYNQVAGLNNVFAVGDTCLQTTDPGFPDGHPQLAQVAIQQGKNLSNNLVAWRDQKALTPFLYNDKGTMAIIGRNKAVADIPKPKLHFKGFIAWLMWLFVHLLSLVNYQNRLQTLYNWTGAYFTRDQKLRLIIRPAESDGRSD